MAYGWCSYKTPPLNQARCLTLTTTHLGGIPSESTPGTILALKRRARLESLPLRGGTWWDRGRHVPDLGDIWLGDFHCSFDCAG